jgi:hypothetical protein
MRLPGIGVIGDVVSAVGTAIPDWIPGGGEYGLSEAIKDPTRSVFTATKSNLSKGPAGSTQQSNTSQQTNTTKDTSGPLGGGGDPAAAQAAAQRASALAEINRILGNIGTQRDQGLARLGASFGDAEARLNRDRATAMQGYTDQRGENEADKLRGTEQVDQFANNSYSNLRRLLLGANAGGSSVARELVPQIVSKAAGQRRQGVFDTYGANEGNIDKAQELATVGFTDAAEDLGNQRRNSEESFRRSILEQEQDLIRQQRELGGIDPGAASAQIASRDAQLNALFNQFAPTFSQKAVTANKADTSKYTVDRAAVQQGQGQFPGETAYYLPALRKKQEGLR